MLHVSRSFSCSLFLSPPNRICSLAKIRSFTEICLNIVLLSNLLCIPSALCLSWFMILQIKKKNYNLCSLELHNDEKGRQKFSFKDHALLIVWDLTLLLNHLSNAPRELLIHPFAYDKTDVQRGKWLDLRTQMTKPRLQPRSEWFQNSFHNTCYLIFVGG